MKRRKRVEVPHNPVSPDLALLCISILDIVPDGCDECRCKALRECEAIMRVLVGRSTFEQSGLPKDLQGKVAYLANQQERALIDWLLIRSVEVQLAATGQYGHLYGLLPSEYFLDGMPKQLADRLCRYGLILYPSITNRTAACDYIAYLLDYQGSCRSVYGASIPRKEWGRF